MRDVFHCTPDELSNLNHADVSLHWEIREAIRKEEDRAKEREQKKMRYNK